MSSWLTETLIIMKLLLSLVILLALKSLCDINMTTAAFFLLELAWYIFFYPFNWFVFLHLECISYIQLGLTFSIRQSLLFYWDIWTIYIIVIIDMIGFKSTILLFVFCILCLIFLLFLPSFELRFLRFHSTSFIGFSINMFCYFGGFLRVYSLIL